MTTFPCPSCGRTIAAEVPPGSAVNCPLCRQVVTVPGEGVAAAPPIQPGPYMGPPQGLRQGMAITSMILGILSIVTGCFPVLGLIGLILGIVALSRANRRPAEYGGRGFAIAGIVTSLASIVIMLLIMVPLLISIMLPSLSNARELAKRSVCAANLARTAQALRIYANRYAGQYPPDLNTLVTLNFAQPSQFQCPSANPADGMPDYEYIPGQQAYGDPRNVLVYESEGNHSPEDSETGGNVLFADGSTRWIEPYSQVERLVAETKERLASSSQAEAEP